MSISISDEDLLKINPNGIDDNNILVNALISEVFSGSDKYLRIKPPITLETICNSSIPLFLFQDKLSVDFNCKDYGILKIKAKFLLEQWRLYGKMETISIEKNNKSGLKKWEEIERLKHPLNSLIICDNYILSEERLLANNLFPILKALLPTKDINEKVNVMIIYSQESKAIIQNQVLSTKILADIIHKYIQQQLFLKNIEVCVIKANSLFYHDRRIFTNYFAFESGNTFNYFDSSGAGRIRTKLHIFPFIALNKDKSYLYSFLDDLSLIKDLIRKSNSNSATEIIGSPSNKLLNIVP